MHFLDPDSKIMQAMTFLADLLLLSVCFIITSIPIVTIGASATAFYSLLLRDEDTQSSITIRYFKAFAANWKPATISWCIQLVLTILLTVDLYFLQFVESSLASPLQVISIVLLIILSVTGSLLYPQIARYENKIGRYWRNAFLLCFPKMWMLLPNLLLFLFPEIVLFIRPDIYLQCLILRLVLITGFQFYMSSLLMKKLFRSIEKYQ